MIMTTWSVHGLAVVQFAFWGIMTFRVALPLCMVVAVDPAGNTSPITGWVVDQTGLLIIVAVHFV